MVVTIPQVRGALAVGQTSYGAAMAKKKAKAATHSLELVPLSSLQVHVGNPKDHDLGAIVASFRRFGFTLPLLENDSTGVLLAGHGRVEALSCMAARDEAPPRNIVVVDGEWLVPVIRGNELEEGEHEAYMVADNRLVELGGWNDAKLAPMLQTIQATAAGLEAVGFDDEDLAKLLEEAANQELPPVNTERSLTQNHQCPACGHEWREGGD